MSTYDPTTLHPIAADVLAVSGGRLGATGAAVIALAGTVVGGIALARAGAPARAGTAGSRIDPPTTALALGAAGTVLGALFVATADGGLGTGNGLGGALVAVALGLVAVALGGLARARRRTTA